MGSEGGQVDVDEPASRSSTFAAHRSWVPDGTVPGCGLQAAPRLKKRSQAGVRLSPKLSPDPAERERKPRKNGGQDGTTETCRSACFLGEDSDLRPFARMFRSLCASARFPLIFASLGSPGPNS